MPKNVQLKNRSIKEILDEMRSLGDVSAHFANELEVAINREFKEYADELKAELTFLLKNDEEEEWDE